jgi:N-acetylglucosamine kinase-like BadF-type ATPase
MTAYFAGVDGGGTKTAIVVVDQDGNEVARHTTTTSNAAVVGHDRAVVTLRELITGVAKAAGITLPMKGIWCGLSGSDRPEDHVKLRPGLHDLTNDLTLTNDAELAMGALPHRVGVAMVSGTGSITFGRNSAGERHRASGWGHIFGDFGSGYDVGRKALYHYSAQIDGYGPETSLVPRLTDYWNLPEPYSIINRVYGPNTTKGDIARLSRVVVDEASKGDTVSRQILQDVADDLATYADAVARKLELGPEINLALVGGMLTHVEVFRQHVLDRLRANWTIGSVELVTDPALTGAQAIAASWKDAHS